MDLCQVIELKKDILKNNEDEADALRVELKEKQIFYINIMSSPGSGKTTTIMQTIHNLKDRFKIGVMEAAIDSAVDAETVGSTGVKTVQLHTGGMCHLDADMSRQGFQALGLENLDLVILENVGNLVCPAEFDSGACKNIAILSVPEGDDKPLKYPLMFELCDVVLINKIDTLPVFDFDLEIVKKRIHERNPKSIVIPISAKTGEGIVEWCNWISKEIEEWNA